MISIHCHGPRTTRIGAQRPRKGALLDIGALGEPRQPGGVLWVERDVQPVARSLHGNERTTRTSTKRVPISQQLGRTRCLISPGTGMNRYRGQTKYGAAGPRREGRYWWRRSHAARASATSAVSRHCRTSSPERAYAVAKSVSKDDRASSLVAWAAAWGTRL